MKINKLNSKVVVPWDFSEISVQALQDAIEMCGADSVQVIHVAEHPTAYEYGVVWDTVNTDVIATRLKETFKERTASHATFSNLELHVAFGNPGKKICEFAKEHKASLIIMPSHGRSGLSRLVLGSVAERVVRSAPCPVLILRDDEAHEKAASALASGGTVLI